MFRGVLVLVLVLVLVFLVELGVLCRSLPVYFNKDRRK